MPAPKDPEKYELWKQRMSEAHKGNKNIWFGKHLPQETRDKISNSMKGDNNPMRYSSEARKNNSDSHKGNHHSKETRIKMSNTRKGKHLSESHKQNISKSKMGKIVSEESKIKNSISHIGKIPSKETRLKLSELRRGEKCYRWKGGITPLHKAIRDLLENKLWIMGVFKRDNFTCQRCFKTNIYLNAHHKKLFSQILEENKIVTLEQARNCLELWDINNGITLCNDCHKKEHKEQKEKIFK
jgi:hypothetical protein